jgi:hypothetical protein
MDDFNLGRICYETYAEKREWKNFLGEALPPWEDLSEGRVEAWMAAAKAVKETLSEGGQ